MAAWKFSRDDLGEELRHNLSLGVPYAIRV